MKLKSITAADFIGLKVPPRQYVFSPFLPVGGLAEIYARTGVGKTTFALALSVAAATGKDFFSWQVKRSWNVLYVDGEMSTQEMQERLTKTSAHFDHPTYELTNLRLICRDRLHRGIPDIGSTIGQSWFDNDAAWADLIFLDNISCLWWTGKENDADSWSVIQQWLLKLKADGKSVIMLHHSGKNGTSRGTSRRHDILDTVIKLEHPMSYSEAEGAKFEVHFDKTRGFSGSKAEPLGLQYQSDHNASSWLDFEVTNDRELTVTNLLSGGMKQQDIAEQLGISQSQVSKIIGRARSRGVYQSK